jgi:hypothetical protein
MVKVVNTVQEDLAEETVTVMETTTHSTVADAAASRISTLNHDTS